MSEILLDAATCPKGHLVYVRRAISELPSADEFIHAACQVCSSMFATTVWTLQKEWVLTDLVPESPKSPSRFFRVSLNCDSVNCDKVLEVHGVINRSVKDEVVKEDLLIHRRGYLICRAGHITHFPHPWQ